MPVGSANCQALRAMTLACFCALSARAARAASRSFAWSSAAARSSASSASWSACRSLSRLTARWRPLTASLEPMLVAALRTLAWEANFWYSGVETFCWLTVAPTAAKASAVAPIIVGAEGSPGNRLLRPPVWPPRLLPALSLVVSLLLRVNAAARALSRAARSALRAASMAARSCSLASRAASWAARSALRAASRSALRAATRSRRVGLAARRLPGADAGRTADVAALASDAGAATEFATFTGTSFEVLVARSPGAEPLSADVLAGEGVVARAPTRAASLRREGARLSAR